MLGKNSNMRSEDPVDSGIQSDSLAIDRLIVFHNLGGSITINQCHIPRGILFSNLSQATSRPTDQERFQAMEPVFANGNSEILHADIRREAVSVPRRIDLFIEVPDKSIRGIDRETLNKSILDISAVGNTQCDLSTWIRYAADLCRRSKCGVKK